MSLDSKDILLIIGGACGFTMVLGGIILLYKGAVKLNELSNNEALSVEFKEHLKIQTRYPALALFIIGLCFIISTLYFVRYLQPQLKLRIIGKMIIYRNKGIPLPPDSTITLTLETDAGKSPVDFRKDITLEDYSHMMLLINGEHLLERRIPVDNLLDRESLIIRLPPKECKIIDTTRIHVQSKALTKKNRMHKDG